MDIDIRVRRDFHKARTVTIRQSRIADFVSPAQLKDIWKQTDRYRVMSPVHVSDNVEATLSNATSRTIVSKNSNVASTLLPFLATMSNEISSF